MSATGLTVGPPTDAALVAGVRAGEDSAFEELYRRYRPRVIAFVRRYLRDDGRAEDITQEAFLSAFRRMRVTDSEIVFKPWIYEIARNAAIDAHRRSRRGEEVSMSAIELLPPSDRLRLVGPAVPESSVVTRERLRHLRGAFDELSETHHRVLVMRELEGLSYREIAERMDLTRPAVESTLFRARRRLQRLYADLETGRRCDAVLAAIGRLAEGLDSPADTRRLARHARRCPSCRRRARELGVEPLGRLASFRSKAAALLPLPILVRPRAGGGTAVGPATAQGNEAVSAFAERAVALLAAAALASAGSTFLQERVVPPREAQPTAVEPAPAPGFGIPRLVLPSPPAPRAHPQRRARHQSGHRQSRASTPAASAQSGTVPHKGTATAPTQGLPVAPQSSPTSIIQQKPSLGSRVTSDVEQGLSSTDPVLKGVKDPSGLPQALASTLRELAKRSTAQ